MNLTSPKELSNFLDRHGFKFTKSLGQNFLIDQNIVEKIVRQAQVEGENVLEIGPGIGTLTRELAKSAKKVLAIEIDNRLEPILAESLDDLENTKVIFDDVLKVDIDGLTMEEFNNEPFKVVANLPYYITSPILIYLLKSTDRVSEINVMMQREVAERIVANVGGKDYGSISVFLKYFGDSKIVMHVPNSVFMPRPKVGSTVIKLKTSGITRAVSLEHLEKTLRAGFGQRRKTIINSLSSGLGVDKESLKKILFELGISENARAENLTFDDYVNLTKALRGGKEYHDK